MSDSCGLSEQESVVCPQLEQEPYMNPDGTYTEEYLLYHPWINPDGSWNQEYLMEHPIDPGHGG